MRPTLTTVSGGVFVGVYLRSRRVSRLGSTTVRLFLVARIHMNSLVSQKVCFACPRGIGWYHLGCLVFFFFVTQKESNFWLNNVFAQSTHLLSVEDSRGRTETSNKVFI